MKYVICREKPTLGDRALDFMLGWPVTLMLSAAAIAILSGVICQALHLWN